MAESYDRGYYAKDTARERVRAALLTPHGTTEEKVSALMAALRPENRQPIAR